MAQRGESAELLHSSRTFRGHRPRGYAVDPPTTPTRLTFAYRKSPTCDDGLLLTIRVAGKLQLPLPSHRRAAEGARHTAGRGGHPRRGARTV